MTFDKLFTSLNLLQYLGSKGVGATGTFQANLRVKCPITYEKEMAKKPRGQWTIATILLTKSLSEDRMAIALSLQHPIVKQLISLGKQSDTQGRKRKSLKLINPMLLGTITKTWVGWIAWTKILASTEFLSALRNGGCHCSCLCLMLPWKILGYFTESQMEPIEDLSICWVSKEKLLIFTAENTRLENVELALLDAQFLLFQEGL